MRVVTIAALIHNPMNIAKNDFLFDNPNKYAATQPVQAPVTGNGIPTNNTKPQNSNLSINIPFFLVRVNSHKKKLSINFQFLKKLDIGSIKNNTGMEIIKLPIIEKNTASYHDSSCTSMAHGIAPRNSVTGSIDRKNGTHTVFESNALKYSLI